MERETKEKTMKLLKKQNWKYGKSTYDINGQIINVFQNTDNGQWYATNVKGELEAHGKTRKSVIEQLKNNA